MNKKNLLIVFIVSFLLGVTITQGHINKQLEKNQESYEFRIEQKDEEIIELENKYEKAYDSNLAKEKKIEELESELEDLKNTYNNN